MTDPDLVLKKLARIETCVADLRRLANPVLIDEDLRERRFVEHTLQIAIQAAIDAAGHIVADERLGEPRTQRELFHMLRQDGWIASSLAGRLQSMCGFRNVLVHGHDEVDLAIVRDICESRLQDPLAFVEAVRGRILGT